jgi:hypothetical protein
MSVDKQAEAKQLVQGVDFGEIFKDLDLSDMAKRIARVLIDLAQEKILPRIQQMNPTLAFVLAGVLDALEKQVQ